MNLEDDNNKQSRRVFISKASRLTLAIGIGGLSATLLNNSSKNDLVWQLDPKKCVQCGRCATSCVKTLSAVKCIHVYDMCGYCDLCGGYLRPNVKDFHTGAEFQLCPTGAIERKFIEEPYFEYHIDEELCNGCGKCVTGCDSFGNGSLQLQIQHDYCDNCNYCAIARDCPADAFEQVPADNPYLLSGSAKKKQENS